MSLTSPGHSAVALTPASAVIPWMSFSTWVVSRVFPLSPHAVTVSAAEIRTSSGSVRFIGSLFRTASWGPGRKDSPGAPGSLCDRLGSRIQQELAASLAALQILVRADRLGQAIGAARHGPHLAARGALVEIGQRRPDQTVGVAHAVHQPEADDRPRLAQQQAGLDLVRLAPGDPVGDHPPERSERAERPVEDLPARHLEDGVDAAALVGL